MRCTYLPFWDQDRSGGLSAQRGIYSSNFSYIAMSGTPLSDWPPILTDAQLESLTLLATTYALSHGLVYLPAATVQPPAPTSTIHAPLALFPAPFPRRIFERAQRLQRIYNVLYARVAMDEHFLDRVMGEVDGIGKVDEFTGQLWRRWRRLRDEKYPRVCGRAAQTLMLCSLTAALATRALPIGLSCACPREWRDIFSEAGRVQYDIGLLWMLVRAVRQPPQVCIRLCRPRLVTDGSRLDICTDRHSTTVPLRISEKRTCL